MYPLNKCTLWVNTFFYRRFFSPIWKREKNDWSVPRVLSSCVIYTWKTRTTKNTEACLGYKERIIIINERFRIEFAKKKVACKKIQFTEVTTQSLSVYIRREREKSSAKKLKTAKLPRGNRISSRARKSGHNSSKKSISRAGITERRFAKSRLSGGSSTLMLHWYINIGSFFHSRSRPSQVIAQKA